MPSAHLLSWRLAAETPEFRAYKARLASEAERREMIQRMRANAAAAKLSPAEREFLYGSHAERH